MTTSRMTAPASRMTAPASRTTAPAWRMTAPASRMTAPTSRTRAPAWRMTAPASRMTAPASRMTAPASRMTAPAWRMTALASRMTAPAYDPLAAQIAEGGHLGSMPTFDGTDLWPLIAGTQASFPNGYVVGDTWVSGPGQPIVIALSADGVTLNLAIHHPVVTMPLDAAHQKATRGILSGVIPTSPLLQQLQIALSPTPTLGCDDGGLSGLAQIAEASDILQDGTQDPTQTCDGISIGLGFDALPVQLGPTVQPLPQPFPCDIDAGDAGADGG